MDKKYQSILDEYSDIQNRLSKAQNPQELKDLGKKQSELALIVEKIRGLDKLEKELAENVKLLEEKDEDIRRAAAEEAEILKSKISGLKASIDQDLIPKDPLDDRYAIMEIRAGAGGRAFWRGAVSHVPKILRRGRLARFRAVFKPDGHRRLQRNYF